MNKVIANPDPVKVIARTSECMRRLMEGGLSYEALQMPIDDPKLRARLVHFWLSGGVELADKAVTSLNSQWLRAREIMGNNFFGIEEAMEYFGVSLSKSELDALSKIPFSESLLESCRGSHILIAVFPLSILDLTQKFGKNFFYLKHEERFWYLGREFAKDQGQVGWHLLRKEKVSDSRYKNWKQQKTLLLKDEKTPSLQVLVYSTLGHYLATGERLFEDVYVRCPDILREDNIGPHQVVAGNFDEDGFQICTWDTGGGQFNVWLASEQC